MRLEKKSRKGIYVGGDEMRVEEGSEEWCKIAGRQPLNLGGRMSDRQP